MMVFKYVVFDAAFPVLLVCGVGHNKVVCEGREATSAGFCRFIIDGDKIDVVTFGESASLKLKPAAGDADLILAMTNTKIIASILDYPELRR